MNVKPSIAGALIALLAVIAAVLAASGLARTSSPAAAPAAPTAQHAALKVGLVTDIGGLNDRSFNHSAYVGLQRAGTQLGVDTRVLESHSGSDYIPNLSTLAQQNYDLVIGVGFLMADAIKTVAEKFPNTKFMIVDSAWPAGGPTNLEGTVFHEEQAGYLVGYLSGLIETGKKVISSVGGQKIPPVDHYIAGFIAGAHAANPKIKELNGYSQDFVAQDKCKNLALQQISQGSKVVFQVAGGCGLGALDAAKSKHVWGIGVDVDQAYLGPDILTSAVKRVDNDVFSTIRQVKAGAFKGGQTYAYQVSNGGIDIGKISPKVPKKFVKKVMAVKVKIGKHLIKIPSTVK
ncbi:MAG: BMP family ABC transporter substrate-binding protein [Gaiellaceae bacterium]